MKLVSIMPIEFHQRTRQRHRNGRLVWKNPRLLVYWDFRIDPNLTKKELDMLIKASHLQRNAVTQSVSHFLTYRYGKEPILVLDRNRPTKIFTTRDSLNVYEEGKCMQQASILLRMLRGSRRQQEARPPRGLKPSYAHFTAVSVTFNPSRIGRTPEERDIIHRAECYLFGDSLP
jgi:hypothetical protein